ncbi:peptidoglycan-binding domain-containing protein [Streptomyces calvus]|uniref:Peptidoglycan binding-like domain-containing protein n=1 Tax=Streptomyces calvus TaxID=67282 RepID=A0AA40SKS2_9ACTN|nr:peptidoglycan-binding domain-containing protein [Streptomyces calvus]MBA8948279.1 hypothetical protein [Streptomyces calvus]GGP84628.1 hypothetical protein GCM10010247_67440 [Streptomyces calvus]
MVFALTAGLSLATGSPSTAGISLTTQSTNSEAAERTDSSVPDGRGNAAREAIPSRTDAPDAQSREPAERANPDPTARPTLSSGSSGTAVRELQRLLTRHGHSTAVDGLFGPHTEKAVRAFQTDEQLVADGIVGPKTWGALTAAPPAEQPAPSPDAPNSCWEAADTDTNYAYKCAFRVVTVNPVPSAETLKDAVFAQAISQFSDRFPFGGCGQVLTVGQICRLQPGNAPVKVVAIGKDYFQLKSLPGHPEGEGRYIKFSLAITGNELVLNVHAWGKPSYGAKGSVISGFVEHIWGTYAQKGIRTLVWPQG